MRKTLLATALVLLLAPAFAPQAKRKPWLRGVWEGTGYQTDTESTWPMTLNIIRRQRQRAFLVDYPSLKCGGRWQVLNISRTRATFKEVLERGQSECLDNGRVILQRINNTQLLYLYSNQGSRKITASGILNRRMPANR